MKNTMSRSAQDPVETLCKARIFDTTKRRFGRLGLGHPGAARAARGPPVGILPDRSPCHECQQIVDNFPATEPRGFGGPTLLAAAPRSSPRFTPERLFSGLGPGISDNGTDQWRPELVVA